MDGQSDGQTEERIHLLCMGWRNLFLCQFVAYDIGSLFVVAGKFITTRKKNSSRLSGGLCCCVSFWFWQLGPEKKVLVVCLAGCAVVSVFGSGGK